MYNSRRTVKNNSQNWGSSFLRTKISREPYLLQKRTLGDLKYWEWLFIVISMLGILINLGFNGYQLTMTLINKERYLFPILLIINNLFAIYFLITGIIQELPFQIVMQLITRVVIWIFNLIYFLSPKDSVDQEDDTENEVKAIRFYISSSMLFLTLPTGGFVLHQYWTSNLYLFKTVGTEPKYVNMYRNVFFGQSLIALDAQMTIVALLLVASAGLSTTDLFALIVLPLGLVLVLIWAFLGIFAMKKESRYWTYTFYIFSHLQPVYVIYLVVRSSKGSIGPLLFFSVLVTATLFFMTHISLLVTVVKIQMNFNKGLKQAAEKEIARSKSIKSLAGSYEILNTDRSRPSPQETDI